MSKIINKKEKSLHDKDLALYKDISQSLKEYRVEIRNWHIFNNYIPYIKICEIIRELKKIHDKLLNRLAKRFNINQINRYIW